MSPRRDIEAGPPAGGWVPRRAYLDDVPAIEALIPLSVRGLQGGCYSEAQREAALVGTFAVDRQLIRDGTYLVVEDAGRVIGCGGWSRRRAVCGGDSGRGDDPEIDPATEPARIRAFFVHPSWARRGVGRSMMAACESAVTAAGFGEVTIASTLTGQPLYASFGYIVTGSFEIDLPGDLVLPCVRMVRRLSGPVEPRQQPGAEG